VIARTTGALVTVAVLLRGRSGLLVAKRYLHLTMSRTRRLLYIGLPAAADGSVMWIGNFVFLAIIARLAPGTRGEAIFAAHIIAVRIEALTYLPASAWAAAAATMIGQNLGAGQPARARQAGHEAALQCGLLAVVVGAFFFFGAAGLFHLMHNDPLVHQAGIGPFKIVALFQPLLAISIVYTGALRGAGDSRYPLLITIATLSIVRLPLGYLLGITFGWALLGVWVAMCCDFVLRGILAAIRFAGGKWMRIDV
ncbi:MAG: MATE family efflux transporter, partial [Planctomycetes bacterium]|nr:MATE family efflux transporter [Planctomycetota bacterium]